MKKELRIVFMGTPDFAVETLKHIIDNQYKIVGVITAPDRPAGRGRKLQQSAVKKFALENDLTVLQPTNLKDEGFLKELKELNANLQVVVAFRMLPKVVWGMPEYGTFNLHASLLPDYRGAAPINWAIINGEKKTGTTTFFIDEKIDTGAIILQEETPIDDDETAGDLHDQLMTSGAALVIKTLQQIESGTIETQLQPQSAELKTAYKLNKENTRIDWNSPTETIYNLIRGLSPYPTAWSLLKNGTQDPINVKIYEVEKDIQSHNDVPGTISVEKNVVYIATKDGYITLKEIQLPGKRKMIIKDILNGYTFEKNAKML
ncbi:methionyl-tRNA formyltransferase [Galbibacter sp. EGI 63066]|uniref:methionyl-tRNA formyltransferase n=1 Tax=Galbibacter sp. EGI 63066 TaxID=2993559 RepID=UPI002248CA89|nr:methionyl-tRNA formyltransferase [Galbibacter sp. EGI 63066]MCX2680908.1 methionyl-tRNA formyltransferase [Galbibacter sp. EGI 63066]